MSRRQSWFRLRAKDGWLDVLERDGEMHFFETHDGKIRFLLSVPVQGTDR